MKKTNLGKRNWLPQPPDCDDNVFAKGEAVFMVVGGTSYDPTLKSRIAAALGDEPAASATRGGGR